MDQEEIKKAVRNYLDTGELPEDHPELHLEITARANEVLWAFKVLSEGSDYEVAMMGEEIAPDLDLIYKQKGQEDFRIREETPAHWLLSEESPAAMTRMTEFSERGSDDVYGIIRIIPGIYNE